MGYDTRPFWVFSTLNFIELVDRKLCERPHLLAVVDHFGSFVDVDVLQKSIALDGAVDLRLVLLGKVDGLSIATSLEVEDSVIVPTVFIVSNQSAAEGNRQI